MSGDVYEFYIAAQQSPPQILTLMCEELGLAVRPSRQAHKTWWGREETTEAVQIIQESRRTGRLVTMVYDCHLPVRYLDNTLDKWGVMIWAEEHLFLPSDRKAAGYFDDQGRLLDLYELAGITAQPDHYVEIRFDISSGDGYWERNIQVIRAIGAILRRVDGDCILVSEGRSILGLVRRDGEVTIDPALWSWEQEDREALNVRVVVAELPRDPYAPPRDQLPDSNNDPS